MKSSPTNSGNIWYAIAAVALALTALRPMACAQQASFKVMSELSGIGGGGPVGNLILDQAGNLYGVANWGGTNSQANSCCGTVFRLSKTSSGRWARTVLYEFTGTPDGSYPGAGLVLDTTGNLYGTTQLGGTHKGGTVFKLSPTPNGFWRETVLHSFHGPSAGDGNAPFSQMVFNSFGNLYGTTTQGGSGNCGAAISCGTVFELSPNATGGWNYTIIYNFDGDGSYGGDGTSPMGPLSMDRQGNLYGTTVTGDSRNNKCGFNFGCGEVFELSPNPTGGWTKTTVYAFQGEPDGADPYAGVILDTVGNLYGTTSLGGHPTDCLAFSIPGCGVAFALERNQSGGWNESTVFAFGDPRDDVGFHSGAFPYGSLTFGPSGNLYGTTEYGGTLESGATGYGLVFQLSPSSAGVWKETILHVFNLTQGAEPGFGLLSDSSGNLYGSAYNGGQWNDGLLFEIRP
jgi:hypothetical protein